MKKINQQKYRGAARDCWEIIGPSGRNTCAPVSDERLRVLVPEADAQRTGKVHRRAALHIELSDQPVLKVDPFAVILHQEVDLTASLNIS